MLAPIPLNSANLEAIEALGVATPRYDRNALVPRILHLGVGGFHRAHMALYTDEAAADGGDWGIRGAGLLESDRRMADVLQAQNHLYTLIERDSDCTLARVVGSIVDDGWPVVCEPYRQWVIEDRFSAGRPRWEDAGVLFTDRVHDWELYKLRMLNASHSCMAYLMALAGVVYVDEAIGIPAVRRYLEQLLETEAIPTLAEIPGYPAEDYGATVRRRLENS